MNFKVENFSKEDVVDVYSAIMSVKPEDVANCLLPTGATFCSSGFIERRKALARSRVSSIKRLIGSLSPNYEGSNLEPLKPWEASVVLELKGKSWPNVLGRRTFFPRKATSKQRAYMVTNLLIAMTAIS